MDGKRKWLSKVPTVAVTRRGVGFVKRQIEALVMTHEGFHFRVEVVARLPLLGLGCR